MTLMIALLLMMTLLGAGGLRALERRASRRLRTLRLGLWRPGVGMLAFVVLLLAFAAATRSEWPLALGALIACAILATLTRHRASARSAKPESLRARSLRQAAERLGVEVASSAGDVRAAHAWLIRAAHPDRGGSAAIAAELNAARDVLLRGR